LAAHGEAQSHDACVGRAAVLDDWLHTVKLKAMPLI
jgi:hypothetical protein